MSGNKKKTTLSERIGILACICLIGSSALWTLTSRSCSHKTEESAIIRSDSIAKAEELARDELMDSVSTLRKKNKASRTKKKPSSPSPKPAEDMSRDYFAPEEQVN